MSDLPAKRSLAQDDVDHFHNTFAFTFLILLGFFSLLLPLTPTLNRDMRLASTPSGSPKSQRTQTPPKFGVTCWAPSQFSGGHVEYMNTVCREGLYRRLRGIKEGHGIRSPYFSVLLPTDRLYHKYRETKIPGGQVRSEDSESDKRMVETRRQELMTSEKARKKLRNLVYYQAPLVLLMLALTIEAPSVICSLMGDALPSCANVRKMLDICVVSRSLNLACQTQVLQESVEAVAQSVKKSRNATSCLYLIAKVLNTLIVLVAVCYIGGVVLTDINSMKEDLAEQKPIHEINPKQNSSSEWPRFPAEIFNSESPEFIHYYPSNSFYCFFKIAQRKNRHDYTVQCVATKGHVQEDDLRHFTADASADNNNLNSQSTPTAISSSAQNILRLYQALFSVASALLAVLLIANAFSTISWLRRLFIRSYATSVGLPSNAARDVILLVHMARLTAGPILARRLAENPVWSKTLEETDTEPILEVDANDP